MKKHILATVILTITTTLHAQVWEIVRTDGTVQRIPAQQVDYVTVKQYEKHEYVDLGLPSGTCWATMNLGATSPEDFGEYFAFGETEGSLRGKTVFTWNTYKWCNGDYNRLTKYCLVDSLGIVDRKLRLELDDDAAYVNWGPNWRVPNYKQIRELVETCTWIETTLNSVPGFTLQGPNGNSIFLPASGWINGTGQTGVGQGGDYWGANVWSENCWYGWGFWFFDGQHGYAIRFPRYFGRAIRPCYIPD